MSKELQKRYKEKLKKKGSKLTTPLYRNFNSQKKYILNTIQTTISRFVTVLKMYYSLKSVCITGPCASSDPGPASGSASGPAPASGPDPFQYKECLQQLL